jgi:hypothetical protein
MHELDLVLRGWLASPYDEMLDLDRTGRHKRGIAGWVRYMTKAVAPGYRDKLGVPNHPRFRQPQGPVIGRRAFVSRLVGPFARRQRQAMPAAPRAFETGRKRGPAIGENAGPQPAGVTRIAEGEFPIDFGKP